MSKLMIKLNKMEGVCDELGMNEELQYASVRECRIPYVFNTAYYILLFPQCLLRVQLKPLQNLKRLLQVMSYRSVYVCDALCFMQKYSWPSACFNETVGCFS